jgi:nitrite reductase/ring-hydroxylating ferredoxin subunit
MRLTALIGIMFLMLSCSRDDSTRVPDVYVNFQVTIQEFQIRNTNGVLLVNNQGVAGLIIYKRADNNYVAYDRCSTVEPEKRCAVTPDDPSLTATDPCSGAKFSLYDGNPVKAPATRALKQYSLFIQGQQIFVTN